MAVNVAILPYVARCPISPPGTSCFPENEKTLETRLDISWIWEKERSMIVIFGFGV